MIQVGKRKIGINSFAIRLLAIACMVFAAIGYYRGDGYEFQYNLGWTSFTFFAFLLSEGVAHSSKKGLYFRRMFLFSLISEVAYDYMRFRTFWYWRHSSVMATLLIGLIVLFALDYIKRRFENLVLDIISIAVLGYIAYYVSVILDFAYGGYGMIIIIMFYVARLVTYGKFTEVIVLLYISYYMTTNIFTHISLFGIQYPIAPELFSMIALPFIWMYDGNRGPNRIILQLLQYLAYPITLGVLIALKYFYS